MTRTLFWRLLERDMFIDLFVIYKDFLATVLKRFMQWWILNQTCKKIFANRICTVLAFIIQSFQPSAFSRNTKSSAFSSCVISRLSSFIQWKFSILPEILNVILLFFDLQISKFQHWISFFVKMPIFCLKRSCTHQMMIVFIHSSYQISVNSKYNNNITLELQNKRLLPLGIILCVVKLFKSAFELENVWE